MDLYCEWGGDLTVTPSGDIQSAVGWDEVRQRVIRRLITNPAQQLPDGTQTQPDDIFATDFGIGAGALVDQGFSDDFLAEMERRIALAVLDDAAVDTSVPPNIIFRQPNPTTLQVNVTVLLLTGKPGEIALEVSP